MLQLKTLSGFSNHRHSNQFRFCIDSAKVLDIYVKWPFTYSLFEQTELMYVTNKRASQYSIRKRRRTKNNRKLLLLRNFTKSAFPIVRSLLSGCENNWRMSRRTFRSLNGNMYIFFFSRKCEISQKIRLLGSKNDCMCVWSRQGKWSDWHSIKSKMFNFSKRKKKRRNEVKWRKNTLDPWSKRV